MQAYLNDKKLKSRFVAEIKKHENVAAYAAAVVADAAYASSAAAYAAAYAAAVVADAAYASSAAVDARKTTYLRMSKKLLQLIKDCR